MIGQTINKRYKITVLLGKGAMGTVYRGVDLHTKHEVALKFISSELTVDPLMLERFKHEGDALRQLEHPNIVGYIDAFQWGGDYLSESPLSTFINNIFVRPASKSQHYVIVMEYVEGGSLHELLQQGPLSIKRAQQISLDLCDALIRVHQLNIIHRDIKPENVLISEDGKPKLADFGVARISASTRMTRTGTQVGTPYYMSPEAWEGKPLEAQADIWSLGVVLFEMLTGRVPFDGDTSPAVMTKVLTSEPPNLNDLRADVPPDLVKVITRMLTRDTNQRYQTMREAAVDLERVQKALPYFTKIIEYKDSKQASEKKIIQISGILKTPSKLRPFLGIIGVLAAILVIGLSFLKQIPITPAITGTVTQSNEPVNLSTNTVFPLPTEITDNKGEQILFVPAGEFIMGSNSDEAYFWGSEAPRHKVYLDEFWIDITEVTNKSYHLCVAAKVCSSPESNRSDSRADYYTNSEYDNYPVIYVTYNDAVSYCGWVGGRLPTEAEWEKAARGTEGYLYPWGDSEIKNESANFCDRGCNREEEDPNFDDGYRDTAPVGSYPAGASPYQVLDMAGNVLEWVSDWYASGYYSISPYQNPVGPNSGTKHPVRGGSWISGRDGVRTTARASLNSNAAYDTLGFRCARDTAP